MRLQATLLALAALSLPARAQDAPAPKPLTAVRPVRILTIDGKVIEGRGLTPKGAALELAAAGGPLLVDLAQTMEATIDAGTARAPGVSKEPLSVEADLVNGDTLCGLLVRGVGEKGFVVRSAALGDFEVSFDVLSTLRFPASYAKVEDPPPLAAEKADRFLFLSGDRLDGTVRSVWPEGIKVRSTGGEERSLRPADLLGFALLPAPGPAKPKALAVRVALADGTRISGSALDAEGGNWILRGAADGKDHAFAERMVTGLSVSGGRGVCLADLVPASVEIRPYWGDDPPVLPLRPVADRAFTLDRGPPPPLRLGGRTYLRGLSMFSGTTLTYDLEGKGLKSFVAAVGVDDAGPQGAVEFEVLLDGKSAWKSGVVKALPAGGEPKVMPPIDLAGAKRLALVVHAGPGDDVQDFADWVRAALLP